MSAFSVTAQYKYSYVYEGKTISFRKGEKFQLLSKANNDWWQVRRWNQGEADDIYVPANYMKEVEQPLKEENPLYENVQALLEKSGQLAQGNQSNNNTGNGHIPQPAPKPSPTHKKEPEYAMPNSPGTARKQSSVDIPPKSASPHRDSPIFKEWQKGYALPGQKYRSQSVDDELTAATEKKQRAPPPPVAAKSRDHMRSADKAQKQAMEPALSRLRRGDSPPKLEAGQQAPPTLAPPEVRQKQRGHQRPQSYVYDADETTSSSFSTFKTPSPLGIGDPAPAAPPKKTVTRTFSPLKKTPSPESVVSATGNGKDAGGVGSAKAGATRFAISSSIPAPSIPAPLPPAPSLPEGWKEGKTPEGKTYYYNELTRESSWTCPEPPPSPSGTISPTDPSPMYDTVQTSPQRSKSNVYERVAPSGWTKEINALTQTPIYTNCRTGEKWSLAKNEAGHYYYCTANPNMTLKDLPPVDDVANTYPGRSSSVPDTVYDHLGAAQPEAQIIPRQTRTKTESLPRDSTSLDMISSPLALSFATHVDAFTSRLSNSLKKHGYLQRKKLVDANGKKLKNDKWVNVFVVLQENQLLFYKDYKGKDQGAKPIGMFCLLNGTISPINYKEKKKLNVFQVTAASGEQFYLQAETLGMMNDWYTMIQSAIDHTNEDYKKNPEKYASMVSSSTDFNGVTDSPPPQSKFSHLRKGSSARAIAEEDTEELDVLSGAEKTIRIKGRLRNLIVKRPQIDQLKKKGIIQDAIFGTGLSELAERTGSPVPKFILSFMEHIEKKYLQVVGIYRLSGNAAMVQKLRYQVEQSMDVKLDSPEWADVNIVTGCLKLYLRELPDPLIPFSFFQSFIECAKMPAEKRLHALAAEIDKLPHPNYHTLKALTRHLNRVVEFGHVNKMQANNLGIVFGPTVMRSELDPMEMAALLPVQNALMEIMIVEQDKLFKK